MNVDMSPLALLDRTARKRKDIIYDINSKLIVKWDGFVPVEVKIPKGLPPIVVKALMNVYIDIGWRVVYIAPVGDERPTLRFDVDVVL